MAINLRDVDAIQHQALMRLTLRVMGETHRIFGEFQAWLTGLVLRTVDDAGNVNGAGLMQAMPQVGEQWRQAVQEWVRLFEAAREQAASLPFGALAVKHNAFVGDGIRLEEAMSADDVGGIIQMWQQRRQLALRATQGRIYGDGLNLSQRVWRLENGGLSQIRNTLATAMGERTSATQLARLVEAQLGADQDMPRWTRDRLYGMTASERRQSDKGLLRGTENRGRGISYNALRLARTELQFANHAVTTEIAQHSPWVTGRFVVLSPAHPKIDICDTYAAGGPYPVTDEILPLHPNCLCHYKEALVPKSDFTNQVKGWLRGENTFLDDYQGWLNARQITEPMPWNMSLADSLEMWLGTNQGAQAAALRLDGTGANMPIPVQAPTPTPARIGPAGTAVSSALNIPGRGKYAARYQAALDAIDQVHGDGQLPEIPVKTTSNASYLGAYTAWPDRPKDITIKGKGNHFELTMAHEVGHFLDHMGIGQAGQWATAQEPELMATWRNAINQSQAVRALKDKQLNPGAHAVEITYGPDGREQKITVTPSRKHLNYLLRDDELWARSYAQYIAKRSQNPVMLEQLKGELADRVYGNRHWDDEDFEPIGKAIDQLFGGLGWRQ